MATDVLEEGIDVPECQLVVLFDLRRNIKSLIQSCGRARHAQSEVVVLSAPGGDNEQLVRQVVVAESDMRSLAQRNAVRWVSFFTRARPSTLPLTLTLTLSKPQTHGRAMGGTAVWAIRYSTVRYISLCCHPSQ